MTRAKRIAWRFAAAGAVLVLAYALAGAVLLPYLARSQIERIGAERLHRRVEVDALRFNPFTLRATLEGLRVLEPDARSAFVAVDRIELRLSAASLVRMAPIVSGLQVVHPVVRWVRTGANRYSTDDILAALAAGSPPASAPAPPASAPARFSLFDLRVEAGRFDFEDQPAHARHEVRDLLFVLPGLSTLREGAAAMARPELSALVDGSQVAIRGEVRPFSAVREASLQLDLERFDLARWFGYLPGTAAYRLPGGLLDLHLTLALQVEEGREPRAELRGKVALDDFALDTADGHRLLRLPRTELTLAHAQFPAGRLEADLAVAGGGHASLAGDASFDPLRLQLDADVGRIDLRPLQPFLADRVDLVLNRATLEAKGKVSVDEGGAGGAVRAGYRGDLGLVGLSTLGRASGSDLVKWGRLDLRGVEFASSPLSVLVDRIELSDYYARLILEPSGRMNVQNLVRTGAPAAAPPPVRAQGEPATAAAVSTVAARGPAFPVTVRRVVLRHGQVRFSDRFIQPNYNAELFDFGGTIANLSDDEKTRARVDLQGRVNGAPLVVGGTLQPFAPGRFLDVQASVQGMDIMPFTPYSSRYVGYRIDGGKLSFDVNYHVEDGKLTARNRLVLDQLELGDRVEGADATSLPIRLAIALLKDRDGVIDIDLPVSGSLDAPDFSVGGVVFRALGNLIVKAATAPFAFLGSIFGSKEEESWLEFPPGGAALAVPPPPRLATIARALAERPGLQLDLTGFADPGADVPALQRQSLDRSLRALKRREMAARAAAGGGAATPDGASVIVLPDEEPALLRQLLAAGEAPAATGKPPAGPAPAPIPVAELEQRALARITVGEADLIALGNRRSAAVRDWLVQEGKVPAERIFLRAGHPAAGAAEAGAPPPIRVEFTLR
jgi:hypothetical protein